jgi:hypothetical protein
MSQIIMHNAYIAKDFATRFCIMLGDKVLPIDNGTDHSEQVKIIVERVETAYNGLKQENYHLKNKLQELIKQIELYQSEMSSSKD